MKKFISMTWLIILMIFVKIFVVFYSIIYLGQIIDRRTKIQIQEHEIINNNIDSTMWNPNKKVLIVALDGIQDQIFEENIRPKTLSNNFKYSFKIPNYESVRGWRSVLAGTLKKYNLYTIYDMSSGRKNKATIKSSHYFSWPALNPDQGKVFGEEINLTDKIDKIVKTDQYIDDFSGGTTKTQVVMDLALSLLEKQKNQVIDDLKNNYNIIFDYDTSYDNLMHSIGNQIEEVNMLKPQILNAYHNKLLEYHHLADENTLILATTDHGRNSKNYSKDHNKTQKSAYRSWFYTNRDLTILLGRQPINLFDVKTIVNNWMIK